MRITFSSLTTMVKCVLFSTLILFGLPAHSNWSGANSVNKENCVDFVGGGYARMPAGWYANRLATKELTPEDLEL